MPEETVGPGVNSSAPIPIGNLYYLLCYAWNHFREGRILPIDGVAGSNVADLLAHVLIRGTRLLLRRGVDRGYIPEREDAPFIRGRLIFAEMIKRNHEKHAKTHCEFDELQQDVLHNQILKTTIRNLSNTVSLADGLRHGLRELIRYLPDVNIIRLNRLSFRRVQLSRNISYYDFLIKLCELVYEALLPEETGERYRFRDILRDELSMSRVFEDFVRNFYRIEQNEFKVSREHISWSVDFADEVSRDMLPSMMTDVSLRSRERSLIIDTKYSNETFQKFYATEKVRSLHLYQMFAYLKNLEANGGLDESAAGILLYPTVSKAVDVSWKIQGHYIRVYTLNLSQEWTGIHRELIELLRPPKIGEHFAAQGI